MQFIRYRLLTVILIGVLTSALSLIALVRVLSVTAVQRRERAQQAVRQELDRLAAAGPAGAAEILAAPPALTLIGLRGGVWDGKTPLAATSGQRELFPGLPPDWRPVLVQALSASAAGRDHAVVEQALGGGLLIVAAAPPALPGRGVVWVGYLVPPAHYWHFWLTIVILLAAATALLFSIAVWAVVSFERSASEQERLSHELSQKERLAALGRVVAGVAHEVRNPLASIKLRLDLAAAGAGSQLVPPVAQAITHASSEIARLDRLVADLLVISGRQVGPRARASLGALIRARTEALLPWAQSRGISFEAHGDAAAVIETEKVGRALDNLLRNAVEASPRGATVRAEVVETADAFLLRVEDDGPGVPRSDELFEPFFTTKSDGTGLGLAISRAIARAHGGDLTYSRIERAHSGEGAGAATRFELRLGKSSPDAAAIEDAAA
jgi:signal transduction histidine kinase